ncbi:hypothetical protein K435DRAFT_862628 [Dendrothele bispora CBS 962.96]|uniref:DUF6533 domain-containing protein n=1 Tax=Dendrothele bispora (strain CBS 962.96) TaxID=1314807 RepID=A0A4S8LTM7_DENBC|nr:hypothetical protein K435DRAFT_862628 [Dendrothele bispora CBS 962.96]
MKTEPLLLAPKLKHPERMTSSISNSMILAQISRYVTVSSLTFIVWDIFTNADDEIELHFNRKLGIPMVAYTFCR